MTTIAERARRACGCEECLGKPGWAYDQTNRLNPCRYKLAFREIEQAIAEEREANFLAACVECARGEAPIERAGELWHRCPWGEPNSVYHPCKAAAIRARRS